MNVSKDSTHWLLNKFNFCVSLKGASLTAHALSCIQHLAIYIPTGGGTFMPVLVTFLVKKQLRKVRLIFTTVHYSRNGNSFVSRSGNSGSGLCYEISRPAPRPTSFSKAPPLKVSTIHPKSTNRRILCLAQQGPMATHAVVSIQANCLVTLGVSISGVPQLLMHRQHSSKIPCHPDLMLYVIYAWAAVWPCNLPSCLARLLRPLNACAEPPLNVDTRPTLSFSPCFFQTGLLSHYFPFSQSSLMLTGWM